ncbi:MAG: superoxide dismutase family protein [Lysobacter sp.]|jgi:Cu-Zn family superoxide dismutase|uniref:Superoxide dismutase [Cu-Zn] n=3 Tax=Lysobacteraceae TaxID=32033 RepID=A0ABU7YTF8_9GAMM|nr:superoxide dismutase family protein [Lysobacter luteus]MDV3255018.1 superoxide dismutase family protein [Lysobacter sp.]MDV5981013.1 superoxide dismutase family protein [Lysobacter sp.]CAG4978059.1 Superoxide dismutase-like protein YojM [Lysobacter luteus]HLT43270.1 superoxide dismutase family protein [Luteimonas sp.]
MKTALFAGASALALAACATSPQPEVIASSSMELATTSTLSSASVNLAAASGSLVSGTLRLMPMADGVHLTGEVGGLTPGSTHAIHIHEKGDCSAADASSAGGHFNPTGEPHGKVGTPTHHAGDMNNIVANAEGVAKVDVHAQGVVLGGGAANDGVGRAVVVHAAADDYTSQPSGNAGARVACGVIRGG